MKKQYKYTRCQWNRYVMRNIQKMPTLKLRLDLYFSYFEVIK